MAPHSSTLAWKIPWTEEPGGLQSMGALESDTTERLHFYFSPSCIGEGNGNPLQCSCLENPRDGEAWWAAVCGVAQSRTRLKRLSSSSSALSSQAWARSRGLWCACAARSVLAPRQEQPRFLCTHAAHCRVLTPPPDLRSRPRLLRSPGSPLHVDGGVHAFGTCVCLP